MASLNWTDGIGAASLSNAFIWPGSRFKNWTPAYKPFGERSQNLGTGALNVTAFRDDLTVALEIPGIPNSDQPKALRLQMHLKRGGSVTVVTTPDTTIPILGTCKLAPGADVQIQLSDKTNLEYTFSTVLRGGAGSFLTTPDGTNDFVIWLKADIPAWPSPALPADLSALPQWNDVTGNNNHAEMASAIAQPQFQLNILNGLPGVFFNADNMGIGFEHADRMEFPDNCVQGLPSGEGFIVLKLEDDPPLPHGLWIGLWKFGSGAIGATQNMAYPKADHVITDTFGRGTVLTTADPLIDLEQPHIYNAVSAPGYWVNRMNGVEIAPPDLTNTVEFPDALILNSFPPMIGANRQDAFNSLNGHIFEFIFYSPARTVSQRAAIHSYLAAKWGITLP